MHNYVMSTQKLTSSILQKVHSLSVWDVLTACKMKSLLTLIIFENLMFCMFSRIT